LNFVSNIYIIVEWIIRFEINFGLAELNMDREPYDFIHWWGSYPEIISKDYYLNYWGMINQSSQLLSLILWIYMYVYFMCYDSI
jgi:hypothetical protein